MKQNLGKLDRILRFALAFWWLGPWRPLFPTAWANWLIIIIGLFALVESFTGYCCLHDWLKINLKNQ